MCYFRTEVLYRPGTHESIVFFIEWDEKTLEQDNSCSQELFSIFCIEGNNTKKTIAKAKTVAEAQNIIDVYFGKKLSNSVWIQYCCSLEHDNKKYIIYETWDSASCKYIVSVARQNSEQAYKYIELPGTVAWDALNVTGANLSSEILDIAKEDICSGILDRYITDCENDFIVNEYITDGTKLLLQEIWKRQGSRTTFPLLLYLLMKALISDEGTYALPNIFSFSGEISQCIRGTYQENKYEINTRLSYDSGIWKFAGESLYINGESIILTSRLVDGSYCSKLKNQDACGLTVPTNLSMVISRLPENFKNNVKKFIDKYEAVSTFWKKH